MAAVNLIGSYNYALVALSVLIAMFASYAALDLAGRVTAAGGWTRAVWLLGGAGAMGTGIWSMHYIGMLAFILPIPVAYHWPTVLLSLFAAILASVIALYVVSRQKMGASRAVEIGRATSELQSQSNLVCRLLLEKKKKNKEIYDYKNVLS